MRNRLTAFLRALSRRLPAQPADDGKPFIVRASSFGGRRLRWYRFKSQIWSQVVPVVGFVAGVGTLMFFRGGLYAALGLLLDVVAAWLLVAGTRAGIGVGTNGVTVRSALGRSRHVPWNAVTGFEDVRPPLRRARAGTHAIAVICSDRDPLTTSACRYQRWVGAGRAQQMTWNVARVGSAA
jgi:hypothetical protein